MDPLDMVEHCTDGTTRHGFTLYRWIQYIELYTEWKEPLDRVLLYTQMSPVGNNKLFI